MDVHHESGTPLPPPRFSLRTLLLVVTSISVFLGLSWWISPLMLTGVLFFSLAVGMHVAGNAIGTKLRDGSPKLELPPEPSPTITASSPAEHQVPQTHLSERWSLGWLMIVPTALGVVGSMIAGSVCMQVAYGSGIDVYGLVVAAIAFGLLGGIATFLVVTFCQVMAVAVSQALKQK